MAPIVADRDLSQKRQIHSMNMTFAEDRAKLTAFTGTVLPAVRDAAARKRRPGPLGKFSLYHERTGVPPPVNAASESAEEHAVAVIVRIV